MFKIRQLMYATMLIALGLWGLASMLPGNGEQQAAFHATSERVNTNELMSTAKNLPVQTYEAF